MVVYFNPTWVEWVKGQLVSFFKCSLYSFPTSFVIEPKRSFGGIKRNKWVLFWFISQFSWLKQGMDYWFAQFSYASFHFHPMQMQSSYKDHYTPRIMLIKLNPTFCVQSAIMGDTYFAITLVYKPLMWHINITDDKIWVHTFNLLKDLHKHWGDIFKEFNIIQTLLVTWAECNPFSTLTKLDSVISYRNELEKWIFISIYWDTFMT